MERRVSTRSGGGGGGRAVLPGDAPEKAAPGVSPGTWESRGMSPTGYPGYPTPLRVRIDMRPAEAVERPHWDVSDKPIALDQKNFRKRARSSRLPFNLIFPVAYALNGPISRRISARSVPASVTIVMS